MISLNLLSQKQKDALRAHVIYAMIERLIVVLVGLAVLAGILLLLIKRQLSANLEAIAARQILSSEYVTVNKDVQTLDQQIMRIAALQKLAVSPSSLLRDVAERTPEGIAIASLDVDAVAGEMHLTGIASKREDLLAYETAMRASPFVKNLASPISNLFQKTDVNFQFTITVNVDAMKKAYEPAP